MKVSSIGIAKSNHIISTNHKNLGLGVASLFGVLCHDEAQGGFGLEENSHRQQNNMFSFPSPLLLQRKHFKIERAIFFAKSKGQFSQANKKNKINY